MAGKKDIVEQALKLVVGSGEKVAPKVRTIRNLKGVPIAPPVEFYRGTNPGSTERIVTGAPEWDSYLFAADNPDAARLYGSEIEKITANPDAKILYEGTADWNKIAGRWRKNENMLQYADRAAKSAKEAGYDAAWFKRQSDIGTPIFNVEKFVRGQKADGGRIAKGPGGFLDDVVRMAGKIVSGEGGEEAAKTGIRAYHGSPHDFDKFDMSKIGTGEGAQAYGHGLYFAENEGVAKGYKQNLSYKHVKDKFLDELPQDAEFSDVEDLMAQGHFTPDQTRFLTELRNNDWLGFDYPSQAISAATKGKLQNYDPTPELQDAADKLGSMYEVNIDADPNAFLDWDKPFANQDELERFAAKFDAVNPSIRKRIEDWGYEREKAGQPMPDGNDLVREVFGGIGSKNAVRGAEMMREAGIPGIKFLDAGSRVPSAMAKKELADWQAQLSIAERELADATARGDKWLISRKQAEVKRVQDGIARVSQEAEGTRNYVVFDDKLISIVRKYGIAGASAMLGYNLMENLDPKQALAATMADNDYKSSVLVDEGDDVNNALRLAKDIGGATTENPQVFLTDAKGRQYDAQGNPIQPTQTQAQSNSAATDAAPTPEQVGRRAAEDPATFDAMMERYAVPDRDIADYEALQKEVAQQPQQVQQMTHVGAPPMRDIKVDMPLFGGEYNLGQAPYNVAEPLATTAQTAYDLKTAPLYMTPMTAPIGAGLDVAEGVATGDPLQASMAALGAPGKMTKAAVIGLSNYAMDPAQAEAGPARWFSKAMEVAREIPMNKMTGEQALAMLRKGTSPEELRWTGTEDFLSNRPQVLKEELIDYLQNNRMQPNEVVLGGGNPWRREDIVPDDEIKEQFRHRMNKAQADRVKSHNAFVEAKKKFDAGSLDYDSFRAISNEAGNAQTNLYRLENEIINAQIEKMGGLGVPTKYGPFNYGGKYATIGGEGYTENLFTLPDNWARYNSFVDSLRAKYGKGGLDNLPLSSGERATLDRLMESIGDERGRFREGHWDRDDVLAHTRTQFLEVTPPGANRPYKGYNIDEAQSKWGQEGRSEGFKSAKGSQQIVQLRDELNNTLLNANDIETNLKTKHYADIQPIKDQREAAMEELKQKYRRGEITMIQYNEQSNKVYDDFSKLIDPYSEIYRKNIQEKVTPLRNRVNDLGRQIEAISSKMGMIPEAPFVGSTEGWTDLTIKKSLDKALDSDAEYFTWTPGETHVQRYNLENHVNEIQYYKNNAGRYVLGVTDKSGEGVDLPKESFSPEELKKFLGNEMAAKIVSGEGKRYAGREGMTLDGLDLRIGGEGMRGYYENIFKKRVEDVFKKALGYKPNIEVIEVQTADGPRKQFGIRLTDEMREKARFSDFASGGTVTGGNAYDNDKSVDSALALTREY